MDLKDSALIIIDLQVGITKIVKESYPITINEVLAKNRLLIALFSKYNLPIYMVVVAPKIFPRKLKKAFTKELLLQEMKEHSNINRLVKTGPSAFTRSTYGLESELKKKKIKNVFITGVSTSNGVYNTALDSSKAGFNTYVIVDATADKDKVNYDRAVNELIPKIGTIIKVEELIK